MEKYVAVGELKEGDILYRTSPIVELSQYVGKLTEKSIDGKEREYLMFQGFIITKNEAFSMFEVDNNKHFKIERNKLA